MKKVTVLLSTYNGEKYIREQLDSILQQRGVNVFIVIRDDGSNDSTCEILNKYQERYSNITWYAGTNVKCAKSFLELIMHVDNSSDYYAFADQDDVWLEGKLDRAINELEKISNCRAKLYCSNYQLVDANLNILPDKNHVSTESFEASIVSSCCTGCTTVFDCQLKIILSTQMPEVVLMHDDWAHKVCLAIGGRVIFDEQKNILYRQHENNVEGGIRTASSRIKGVYKRIVSKERIRSRQLAEILRLYGEEMSVENKALMEKVANYLSLNMYERILLLKDHRLRTPYSRLNRGFFIAIILKYF